MRCVVQRVSQASVVVDDEVVASIGRGLVVLVGVASDDGPGEADAVARKLTRLRIFGDAEGKMNRSVGDIGGAVLVVSQFTLVSEVRKGNRPSFTPAADPGIAEPLVARLADQIAAAGVDVAIGRFGATMLVSLVNDGPVTFVLEGADGVVF